MQPQAGRSAAVEAPTQSLGIPVQDMLADMRISMRVVIVVMPLELRASLAAGRVDAPTSWGSVDAPALGLGLRAGMCSVHADQGAVYVEIRMHMSMWVCAYLSIRICIPQAFDVVRYPRS